MLGLYLTCLVVGGVFVGLSLVGGEVDTDAEVDLEVGADVDLDADLEVGADVDLDADGHLALDVAHGSDAPASLQAMWLPFFTFKFWTFGTCFFGMTGSALTWLTPDLSTLVVLPVSIVTGAATGTAVAWALRAVKQGSGDSMIRGTDLVGAQGTAELPLTPGTRGHVRLKVRGSLVEYVATTDHAEGIEVGEAVAVIGVDQSTVLVRPVRALLARSAAPPDQTQPNETQPDETRPPGAKEKEIG